MPNMLNSSKLVTTKIIVLAVIFVSLLLSSCRPAVDGGSAGADAARMRVQSVQTGQVLGPPALIADEVVVGTADGRVLVMRDDGLYLKLSDFDTTSAVRR